MLKGLVINAQKNLYSVKSGNDIFMCRIPGKILREKDNTKSLVVVGDYVVFENTDNNNGLIISIEPRRTSFLRRGVGNDSNQEQVIAANIDQVIISCSVKNPMYKLNGIDRYIVAAKTGNIEPIILFNKIDLVSPDEIENDVNNFTNLGLRVVKTSTYTGQGIDELRNILKDKISVFSGSSGVGKSSLVNAVQEDYIALTSYVGQTTTKGRHTTTSSYLYELSFGGMILDTPGMREFALIPSEEGLKSSFTDIELIAENCKFNDCSHIHEPKCAVKNALDNGEITEQRYNSYIKLNKKNRKLVNKA